MKQPHFLRRPSPNRCNRKLKRTSNTHLPQVFEQRKLFLFSLPRIQSRLTTTSRHWWAWMGNRSKQSWANSTQSAFVKNKNEETARLKQHRSNSITDATIMSPLGSRSSMSVRGIQARETACHVKRYNSNCIDSNILLAENGGRSQFHFDVPDEEARSVAYKYTLEVISLSKRGLFMTKN